MLFRSLNGVLNAGTGVHWTRLLTHRSGLKGKSRFSPFCIGPTVGRCTVILYLHHNSMFPVIRYPMCTIILKYNTFYKGIMICKYLRKYGDLRPTVRRDGGSFSLTILSNKNESLQGALKWTVVSILSCQNSLSRGMRTFGRL